MKRMKKLVSILLVAVMMLAMTTTVFATGTYTITVTTPSNGTVVANGNSADENAAITLTVTPSTGYTLDTLTVTNEKAQAAVTTTAGTAENTYTFKMPSSNVTVTDEFSGIKYTVTIDNQTTGHTYEAYQVFDGTLTGTGVSGDPYVLTNIVWGSGVDTTKTIAYTATSLTEAGVDTTSLSEDVTLINALKALKVSDSYPFKSCNTAEAVAAVLGNSDNNTKDSAVAQAFADLVSLYLSDTKTESTENKDQTSGETTNYTISVTAGYYLIKDQDGSQDDKNDAYTRFILEVVANVTAEEKSEVPTVAKKVKEEDYKSTENEITAYGDGYNDVADYDIGDAVPFELIGTMPSNLADYTTYKYVFHDVMAAGLAFRSDTVEVTVVNGTTTTTIPVSCDSTTNYTVVTTGLTDGCTFEVQFTDILSLVDEDGRAVTVDKDSKIFVKYNATLEENAKIGLNGNENEVYLTFSNNPNTGGEGDTGKTPEDKVIVFTYELDVTKTDNSSTQKKLKDAKFVLYKKVNDTNYYAIVDSTSHKVTGWTTTYADATELVSDDNGFFEVIGLDDGIYYLEETEAPSGYNKLTSPITLTITATTANNQSWSGTASDALTALSITVNDGEETTTTAGTTSNEKVAATVVNTAGSGLPITGGMGTTILYIIGAILVISAGVLLVTRRRLSH